jgi:4-diphosphocytidyl-2-C-methyl-D-erythritol kinase
MIVFPNCKINFGLHILDKREDGFHNLETVFYPVPLKDGLEITNSNSLTEIEFTASGLDIDGISQHNICIKAYGLLKKDFSDLPAIKIHLHKTIPIGAGLGGGSSNGAFTLMLVNQKFDLALTEEQLINYAMQLGSDCPFFIVNKPCFASGRGEKLIPVALDLSAYKMIIVNPGIHINTGWAFNHLQSNRQRNPIKEILEQPVAEWKSMLINDFEEPIFTQYEDIKNCKDQFYNLGALYASMTGSGSTVFGLFLKETQQRFNFPAHYFLKEIELRNHY